MMTKDEAIKAIIADGECPDQWLDYLVAFSCRKYQVAFFESELRIYDPELDIEIQEIDPNFIWPLMEEKEIEMISLGSGLWIAEDGSIDAKGDSMIRAAKRLLIKQFIRAHEPIL